MPLDGCALNWVGYIQLNEMISIAEGAFLYMPMTIYDIAREAGVSAATVSRFIRGHKVRPENAVVLQKIINQSDYQPNLAARSLVTKKTVVAGLIVPDVLNPFYASVFRGFHDALLESGYQVILANSDAIAEREMALVESLQRLGVVGIAIVPAVSEKFVPIERCKAQIRQLDKLRQDGMAIVTMTESLVYQETFDTVSVDGGEAAFLAVQHLLRTGHETIAMVGGSTEADAIQRRIDGCRRGIAEYGLSPEAMFVFSGGTDRNSGYELASEVLRRQPRVTAMLCVNDQVALGVLTYLEDRHINVPAQVAVIGIDDIADARICRPRLSTVAQPQFDIGYESAQILLKRINGELESESPISRVLPVRLKVRDSTWAPSNRGESGSTE